MKTYLPTIKSIGKNWTSHSQTSNYHSYHCQHYTFVPFLSVSTCTYRWQYYMVNDTFRKKEDYSEYSLYCHANTCHKVKYEFKNIKQYCKSTSILNCALPVRKVYKTQKLINVKISHNIVQYTNYLTNNTDYWHIKTIICVLTVKVSNFNATNRRQWYIWYCILILTLSPCTNAFYIYIYISYAHNCLFHIVIVCIGCSIHAYWTIYKRRTSTMVLLPYF